MSPIALNGERITELRERSEDCMSKTHSHLLSRFESMPSEYVYLPSFTENTVTTQRARQTHCRAGRDAIISVVIKS